MRETPNACASGPKARVRCSGTSRIEVEVYNRAGMWAFFMRFTDLDGRQLEGAAIHAHEAVKGTLVPEQKPDSTCGPDSPRMHSGVPRPCGARILECGGLPLLSLSRLACGLARLRAGFLHSINAKRSPHQPKENAASRLLRPCRGLDAKDELNAVWLLSSPSLKRSPVLPRSESEAVLKSVPASRRNSPRSSSGSAPLRWSIL